VPRLETDLDGWLIDPFEPPARLTDAQLHRMDDIGRRLVAEGVAALTVDRLCDHLRYGSPQDVGHIRPLAFARKRELEPDSVVEACLRAAHHGALPLLWDVICPACRIPCDIAESLRAVREHGHCDACNIDFDLDLARSVEMIFRAHPQIREADVATYCVGGPAHSPHVLAQVRMAPGQRFELELELEEGSYQITGRRMPRSSTAWSRAASARADRARRQARSWASSMRVARVRGVECW